MLPRREQANCGKDSELSALDQLRLYLDQCPLIAIIRGVTPAEAEAISGAIFDAGIRIIEVPLNSPEPLKSIERLATKFGDRRWLAPARFSTPADVEDVKAAGGRLIVSPHTNLAVIRAAAAANLVSCPGYFTPSEAFAALDAGATALKLFPAEGATPAVLKAQLAVIPSEVPIFVVGGVGPTICSRGAMRERPALGSARVSTSRASRPPTPPTRRAPTSRGERVKPIRIAILGYGKIAQDQHVPSIAGNPRFELVATSSRSGQGLDQTFTDWRELIRTVEGLEAVAITTPPGPRYEIARECVLAGLHCLLEKPPTAGLAEIADLACLAEAQQVTPVHHLARAASFDGRCRREGPRRQAHQVAGDPLARGRSQMASRPAMDLGAGGIWRVRSGDQRFLDRDQDLPGRSVREVGRTQLSGQCPDPDRRRGTFASPQADGPLTASLDWRRTEGEEWTIEAEPPTGPESPGSGRIDADARRPADAGRRPRRISRHLSPIRRPHRRAPKPGRRRAIAPGRGLPLVGRRTIVEPVTM